MHISSLYTTPRPSSPQPQEISDVYSVSVRSFCSARQKPIIERQPVLLIRYTADGLLSRDHRGTGMESTIAYAFGL